MWSDKSTFAQNMETTLNSFYVKKGRLWIGILNKSISEDIVIEKRKILEFFLLKTKRKFYIKHETSRNKKKITCKTSPSKKAKEWFF